MAIWQFDCMVIPHDNIEMDVDSEDILLWKGENILVDLEEKIEQILKIHQLNSSVRAEQLSIEIFCDIANQLSTEK